MQTENQSEIELTGQIEREEGLYISYCNELPIAGAGHSPQEAVSSFAQCLTEYLQYNDEWGMLDDIFSEKGLTGFDPEGVSSGEFAIRLPKAVSPDRERMPVP